MEQGVSLQINEMTPSAIGRDAYYSEVIRLREELEEAREIIANLREILAPAGMAFPPKWQLTPKESDLLRVLMSTPEITKEHLITSLYDQDPDVEIKIIDVLVCKLRRKIAVDDIKIETIRGRGYRLPPEMKTAVLEEIGGDMTPARPAISMPLPDLGQKCRTLREELELSEEEAKTIAGFKYASLILLAECGKGQREETERLLRSLEIERDRRARPAKVRTTNTTSRRTPSRVDPRGVVRHASRRASRRVDPDQFVMRFMLEG